eukprot:Rmarinus@m.6420
MSMYATSSKKLLQELHHKKARNRTDTVNKKNRGIYNLAEEWTYYDPRRKVVDMKYDYPDAPLPICPHKQLESSASYIHLSSVSKHRLFNRLFKCKASCRFFESLFWYVVCVFHVPRSSVSQEYLMEDMARRYVELVWVIGKHADEFLKRYPWGLSLAILRTLLRTFPGSRLMFTTENYRLAVTALVSEVLTGVDLTEHGIDLSDEMYVEGALEADLAPPLDRRLRGGGGAQDGEQARGEGGQEREEGTGAVDEEGEGDDDDDGSGSDKEAAVQPEVECRASWPTNPLSMYGCMFKGFERSPLMLKYLELVGSSDSITAQGRRVAIRCHSRAARALGEEYRDRSPSPLSPSRSMGSLSPAPGALPSPGPAGISPSPSPSPSHARSRLTPQPHLSPHTRSLSPMSPGLRRGPLPLGMGGGGRVGSPTPSRSPHRPVSRATTRSTIFNEGQMFPCVHYMPLPRSAVEVPTTDTGEKSKDGATSAIGSHAAKARRKKDTAEIPPRPSRVEYQQSIHKRYELVARETASAIHEERMLFIKEREKIEQQRKKLMSSSRDYLNQYAKRFIQQKRND